MDSEPDCMGKSHKDRQKEYREKKKQQNLEEWRRKENERAKEYYKKTKLSRKELERRRERNKMSMRRQRQRKRYSDISQDSPQHTTSSKNHSRKRISRAVSKLNRQIKILEERNARLKRRNWTLEKRSSRMKPHITATKSTVNSPETPKRRTKYQLKQYGMDPEKAPAKLVKRLRVFNCLSKSTKDSNTVKKDQVAAIIGGILRKYRGVRYLGKEIGIDRRLLAKGKAKTKRSRLPRLMLDVKTRILNFLSRDDNSTPLPGKQDYKKVEKEKVQKRVLNDYLANLWMKFKSENPNIKVSLTLFCRSRPKNIVLTSFTGRKRCLCIYHQNLALKMKTIYHTARPNPDMIVKNKTDDMIVSDMEKGLGSSVTYHTWKRQTTPDGRKKIMCVQETQPKLKFIEIMKADLVKFRKHVDRVANQYGQIYLLKEKLPVDHVAVHMNFAENYTCTAMDEIQSAYWNQDMVSLHPAVIYYRDTASNILHHKSLVFISGDLSHNASAVTCIMDTMVPVIQELVPSVKCVHYISDSPVSQYRNRFIMFAIANFEAIFGIQYATWTYLETGHGKGPCDGIGGVAKRNADAAVRQNKVIKQNAEDFQNWAAGQDSKIDYIQYTSFDIQEKRDLLESVECAAVKSTLTVHAVCSLRQGYVTVRETSCFCDDCFSSGLMLCQCDGWRNHKVGTYDGQTTLKITLLVIFLMSRWSRII